jgi:hypothetical protein
MTLILMIAVLAVLSMSVLSPPGAIETATRVFKVPEPVVLSHPSDLQAGDRIVLGKRNWNFVGRQAQSEAREEDECIFECDPAPGGGPVMKRVFAQSEIEALAKAGMVQRQAWCQVVFRPDAVLHRGARTVEELFGS